MLNKTHLFFIVFLFFILTSTSCAEKCKFIKNSQVKISTDNIVTVKENCIVNNELPKTIFGFNLKWNIFQDDIFETNNFENLIDLLKPFQGGLFRFPGGTVANHFILTSDGINQTVFPPRKEILFTHKKFKDLLTAVDGKGLFVLNLSGGGDRKNPKILSDSWLNNYVNDIATIYSDIPDSKISFQLGNELDRNKYEWKPDFYYKRSNIAVKALKNRNFNNIIGFGRHFNWKYKDGSGKSTWKDFTKSLFNEVDDLTDISLHFYYEEIPKASKERFSIQKSLKQITKINNFINKRKIKNNKTKIIITEHSRSFPKKLRKDQLIEFSSSIESALSTADFLISIAQMPIVDGACWHGLNSNYRRLVKVDNKGLIKPGKVYWMMKLLRESYQPIVLSTKTQSIKNLNNESDYNIRSVVLKSEDSSEYSIWLVNRSNKKQNINFKIPELSNRALSLQIKSLMDDGISFTSTANINIRNEELKLEKNEDLVITIPPLSVNVIKIRDF